MIAFDDEPIEEFFLFFMDGSQHTREAETGCCGHFGKPCPTCGGFSHFQPVYGGYFYKCEVCTNEWV